MYGRKNGRFKTRTSGYLPSTGDLILYDWDSNGYADHVGIVVSCDGKTVQTVEGNTGSGGSWTTRVVGNKNRQVNWTYIMGYYSCK